MSRSKLLKAVPGPDAQLPGDAPDPVRSGGPFGLTVFQVAWFLTNILLLIATLVAVSSAVWEFSTRRYLHGFSDAVVPASGTPEEKIEAILRWMSRGPARRESDPDGSVRDPTETLNYASLLKVCGSATNAFVNLADTAGLPSRRLLLLGPHGLTRHVVAEVLMDRRWIIVDPAFRTILRDSHGETLTRAQLSDHSVFSTATSGIAGYDPIYTYDHTAHIRMARLGSLGHFLFVVSNRIAPGWSDSVTTSLLLERESLAATVAALFALMMLVLARFVLRWYGKRRLGINRPPIRARMLRACSAFLNPG